MCVQMQFTVFSDYSIDKYKSLLTLKCFHQQPRVNFEEASYHVAKHATIHIFVNVDVACNGTICQIIVNNAFPFFFETNNALLQRRL